MTNKESYRQLKSELEAIVERFEGSDYEDIEDMLEDYKKANEIIKKINAQLDQADKKVSAVKK